MPEDKENRDSEPRDRDNLKVSADLADWVRDEQHALRKKLRRKVVTQSDVIRILKETYEAAQLQGNSDTTSTAPSADTPLKNSLAHREESDVLLDVSPSERQTILDLLGVLRSKNKHVITDVVAYIGWKLMIVNKKTNATPDRVAGEPQSPEDEPEIESSSSSRR